MRITWRTAVLPLLVLVATAGCATPTANSKLGDDQKEAVLEQPDDTTQALTDAGYVPLSIRYELDWRRPYATVYFAPTDSDFAAGHGTVEKPWISRDLKVPDGISDPKDIDYNNFADGVLMAQGDDWPQTTYTLRPADLPYARYQCVSDPASQVTAEALRQLPGAMKTHAVSLAFDYQVGESLWHCDKS